MSNRSLNGNDGPVLSQLPTCTCCVVHEAVRLQQSRLSNERSSSFSYPGDLLCKRMIVCVAVSVIGILPSNEQEDGRVLISLDRNQARRTKWAFVKDEGRMNPFFRGLPKLSFSL